MSSMKSQNSGRKRARDSSRIHSTVNILHPFPGQRNTETRTQPTEQQSGNSDDPCKIRGDSAIELTISPSTYRHFFETDAEDYENIFQDDEQIINLDKILTERTLNSGISDAKASSSNLLASKNKRESLESVPATKEKTVNGSSTNKPPPFKDFPPHLFELPFTKQVLVESISLKEACGFFKHLMALKRLDFRCIEKQMGAVLTELQKAVRDAKSICMRLENISQTVPLNINALVVEAEKLLYLLYSSFRIFKKLHQCGSTLNESFATYCKGTFDYHVSTDILLEYIVMGIFEKSLQIDAYNELW